MASWARIAPVGRKTKSSFPTVFPTFSPSGVINSESAKKLRNVKLHINLDQRLSAQTYVCRDLTSMLLEGNMIESNRTHMVPKFICVCRFIIKLNMILL